MAAPAAASAGIRRSRIVFPPPLTGLLPLGLAVILQVHPGRFGNGFPVERSKFAVEKGEMEGTRRLPDGDGESTGGN